MKFGIFIIIQASKQQDTQQSAVFMLFINCWAFLNYCNIRNKISEIRWWSEINVLLEKNIFSFSRDWKSNILWMFG